MLSTLLRLSLLVACCVALTQARCKTIDQTSYIYRTLRPEENCNRGLVPKDSRARKTVHEHVAHGSQPGFKSQFISTTTELGIARKWQKRGRNLRIAKISRRDMLNANCSPYDLNSAHVANQHLRDNRAKGFARASCEVVLRCTRPLRCSYV